jgi:hypothetical protein
MVNSPFLTPQIRPVDVLGTFGTGYNMYGQPIATTPLNPALSSSNNQEKAPVSLDFPGSQFLSGNLSKPFFSSTGTVGGAIDKIGSTFGYSGAEQFGPNLPGVAPSNAGLSSVFTPANAIGGFAGNFLGNSLFGGDRGIGANIGGAAGGFAGSAVLGQSVIPIPGVGAAIGALAGNAIGGLFGGNKKPNPASTVGSAKGLSKEGAFIEGGHVSSKHTGTEFGTKMRDSLSQFNSALHGLTGVDFSWMSNHVNHGPGFIAVNSGYVKGHETYNPEQVFTFDPNDPASQENAFRQYGRKVLELNPSLNLTPEQIDQKVEQAMGVFRQGQVNNQGQGSFQGTLGTPMLKKQSGVGNESYADFMKRYRQTGDVNLRMAPNTGA